MNNNKYALLLYGISPYESKKYSAEYDKYYSITSWKKVLSDNHEVDVFIHSWSINDEAKLENIFKPKYKQFEPKIIDDPIKSCSLSMYKVNQLKNKYEKDKQIKYQTVMLCRMDIIWFIPIKFTQFDSTKFIVSHWGITDKNPNYTWNNPYEGGQYGTHDIFFISNSENITLFSELYNNIDNYKKEGCIMTHHTIKRYHMVKIGLITNIEFQFIIGKDLEIESRCWIKGTPGNDTLMNSAFLKFEEEMK